MKRFTHFVCPPCRASWQMFDHLKQSKQMDVKIMPMEVKIMKKYGTLHDFACHPCAGAMLIFSVSFQF